MDFTLKIWRQENANAKGRFETYQLKDISPDCSFLEMLDILNQQLINKFEKPVCFDHDCREGICGACGLVYQRATPRPGYGRYHLPAAYAQIQGWRHHCC